MQVASFDVFDTLIGRAHFHPDTIFDRVSKEFKIPNFKNLRKTAEAQSDKTWNSIWIQFAKISGFNSATINNLKQKEWQFELEETFPILPIVRLVKSEDIFVSDMYITVEMMQQLLEKNGLGKIDSSRIFLSPNGKSQGFIWDKIRKSGIKVKEHIGDNYVSDVQSPSVRGITAFHYKNSQYNKTETDLVTIGHHELANLARMVRLSNPFEGGETRNSLWNEFASLNVPFLVHAAHGVLSLVKSKNAKRVLFATRDCCFLEKVFGLLFPQVEKHTFYSSRALYFHPTIDYINYAKKLIDNDTLIVDIHGTASSLTEFIKGALTVKPHILMMSISGSGDIIKNYGKGYYFINGLGDNIERLNVDTVGTYFDFVGEQPIHQHNELDETNVKVFHDCFAKMMDFAKRLFLVDLSDENQYSWTKEVTGWHVKNFYPETAKQVFKWEPYHFYTNCDLDLRRDEYRKKLGLKLNESAKCPQVIAMNRQTDYIPKPIQPVVQKEKQFQYKSQIGQDKYYIEKVAKYGTGGFFLDVGAHNGIDLSNTFVLEKSLDWKGICIEANPFVFESLTKNRSAKCVNACVWSSEEEIILEFPKSNEIPEGNDMLVRISGLQGNENYFPAQFQKTEKYKTLAVKLETILDQEKCPLIIDYLSIDIEGAELEVLKPFNFEKYHINFIAIEHGYRQEYRQKLRDFFLSKGFKLHRENQFDDEYENVVQKPTFNTSSNVNNQSENQARSIVFSHKQHFAKIRSMLPAFRK